MADILKQFDRFKSLDSVYRSFPTQRSCKEWLARVRWEGNVVCPHCGGVITYKTGRGYHCEECNRTFTATVGTIFESTKIPLRKWFAAVWLTINNKKGVSACMLARELGVSYPTAWHLLHKIRTLLPQPTTPLDGPVQVDCGYVGGLLRWTNKPHGPKDYLRNKVALLGLASDSEYRIRVIPEGNSVSILPVLGEYLTPSNVVYTDEGREFNRIRSVIGAEHYTTNHAVHQWRDPVSGASTSKIESAWSHIKRHHKGVYHVLPKKRAQRYVDEFVYRYNTLRLSRQERAQDFFSRIFLTVTWKDIDRATA